MEPMVDWFSFIVGAIAATSVAILVDQIRAERRSRKAGRGYQTNNH